MLLYRRVDYLRKTTEDTLLRYGSEIEKAGYNPPFLNSKSLYSNLFSAVLQRKIDHSCGEQRNNDDE
ncbi:hypothetical protein ACFL6I_27140, partial [candidate division KSB1 bacterium]